jgi:heat-inducible transcriptional repressor
MQLSERKKKIIKAVIEEYIATAEPVGSKSIALHAGLGLSSATIRNEMAELEALGYLEQPHTSAGRIPSVKGYRIYVNELMRRQSLSVSEAEEINRSLRKKMRRLDKAVADAGKLTAKLTHYPAYVLAAASSHVTIVRFDLISVDANTFIIVLLLSTNAVKNKLVRLPTSVPAQALVKLATVFNASFTHLSEEQITPQLIASTERASGDSIGLVAVIAGYALQVLSETKSSETYVSGASHLLQQPEFHDVDKAQRLLTYLSDSEGLAKLPSPDPDGSLKITIGPENLAEELKDSSVVVAKYDAGNNMQGLIGVVGPTRMDYAKVSARLAYIANGLSKMFSDSNFLLPGFDAAKDDDNEEHN